MHLTLHAAVQGERKIVGKNAADSCAVPLREAGRNRVAGSQSQPHEPVSSQCPTVRMPKAERTGLDHAVPQHFCRKLHSRVSSQMAMDVSFSSMSQTTWPLGTSHILEQ